MLASVRIVHAIGRALKPILGSPRLPGIKESNDRRLGCSVRLVRAENAMGNRKMFFRRNASSLPLFGCFSNFEGNSVTTLRHSVRISVLSKPDYVFLTVAPRF